MDPAYELREAREEQFQAARERRERFGEPITRKKTMTHYELLQACRNVRDNLGRSGWLSVECDVSEWAGVDFNTHTRGPRLNCVISWQDRAGGIEQVNAQGAEAALSEWTEMMRRKYGPKHVPTEGELAEVLDAHKVEAA